MPVYIFYEEIKNKFLDLEKSYENILAENEKIFQITQPKSPTFSDLKVQNNEAKNKFDTYLELKEKLCIEKRLEEARRLLKARSDILHSKEKELRSSGLIDDKVYCMWALDKKTIREISRAICYQKSRIYDIVNRIKVRKKTENIGKKVC